MTFGKEQDPSKAGKKSGASLSKIRNKALSKMMEERWKNPEYRKQALKQLRRARQKVNTKKAGKKSRLWENILAKRLEKEYSKVFLPQTICDRICVTNDGKFVFIEIKKIRNGKKDKLRPKQKEFKNLCNKLGYKYIVKYLDLSTIPEDFTLDELKELEKNHLITITRIIKGEELMKIFVGAAKQ